MSKCCPATVTIDPPLDTPNDGFKPTSVGGCTTAKSSPNMLSVGDAHDSVALSISWRTVGVLCGGMAQVRMVDVKNVDTLAAARLVSKQHKTLDDGSNPLPTIVTTDGVSTNPKLGEMLSYTESAKTEMHKSAAKTG
jgi:hypothetical protein